MTPDEEESVGKWQLKRGEAVLATLVERDQDFPWVYCDLKTAPEFEQFRFLFEHTVGARRGKEAELHEKIRREGIGVFSSDGV